MKGDTDKQWESSRLLLRRVEWHRSRLASVAAGCFFLFVLLSSRHGAIVGSNTRRDDITQRQGASHAHLQHSDDMTVTQPAEGTSQEAQDKSLHAAAGAITSKPAVQPLCDFSGHRSDVCDLSGDIRMDANASTFIIVAPASSANEPTYKIRPYPRKGDATSMGRVTELTVQTTTSTNATPRCTVTHTEPAVVFSIGGYTGNLFHDFTDVIVPLYNTAQSYRGDVRLIVTNAASWWLVKYGALLRGLSRHAPLDLAKAGLDGEIHCFSHAVVGLRAHRELMIETERNLNGVGMPDFTRFLRVALSLPRNAPTRHGGEVTGNKKPRLLIISRRGTRLLLNIYAVVRMAEEVGFEVVVSELDMASDMAQTGRVINSFDALVGVHGAGLTNMVFLPPGATMVQIVPWGGLTWLARMDFGDPAMAMGLRYIQYEIGVDESTLKDEYPRDHEIFTNPTVLHKKGFKFMRHTFLNGQNITIDVDRFRAVLLQAFENLTR